MAGRGSHPGLVHHTFAPLPVGGTEGSMHSTTGGTCTGHNDKTKLPNKMLLPSGHLGYTTMIFRGHSAINPVYTGGQPPGLVPKVPGGPAITGPHVKTSKATSTEQSLGFIAVIAGSKILFWWPNPSFSDSLVYT